MAETDYKLVISEINAAGRSYAYNEELEVQDEEEPVISTAYFAEKKIVKTLEADATHTYTFTAAKDTSTSTKISAVAATVRNEINTTLASQKKEVRKLEIEALLTATSYAKDATLANIPTYNVVEITTYPKLTSVPMGYQVYLVVETLNLDGKKAKIKIQEKENDFKIVASNEEALPVLVFANLDDATTQTEVSDWIEINVKEENGKKENGAVSIRPADSPNETDKIEVGIKKIQLRPKEPKIQTEGEAAKLSFEGWQEALFVRENETVDGIAAAQAAETLATTRAASNDSVTLTRDANADLLVNKKSFPESISGPSEISINGSDAEFILETYKSGETTADKQNIRWSLWVHGTPMITTLDKENTYVTSKSKPGLYTYAKTEIIDIVEVTNPDGTITQTGGKNKLTIVFDKALKGKRIQIEAFRGSPDIKVKEKDKKPYVYTNVVKDFKITERETTNLRLQTQCDSVINSGELIEEAINNVITLKTSDAIHIFHDGKLTKTELQGLDKIIYIYHDDKGEVYKISTCDLLRIKGKSIGVPVSSFRTESAVNIIDYESLNVTNVNAKKSRVYSNGDVITDGKKYSNEHYKIEYKCLYEDVILVHMKELNRVKKPKMKYHFHETLRQYSNPFYFAAFIGALIEIEFDVSSGGSCYEDGSAFPSLEHSNGFAIDTGYKYSKASDEKIMNALKKFGFTKRRRGSTTYLNTLTGHSSIDLGSLHDTHLHSGKLEINEI